MEKPQLEALNNPGHIQAFSRPSCFSVLSFTSIYSPEIDSLNSQMEKQMKYDFIVGSFQPLNNLKPGHMKPGVKITCDSHLGTSLPQTQVHTPGLFSEFRSKLSITPYSAEFSRPDGRRKGH